MNNTALRAGAQSATGHKESVAYGDHPYDITHIVFAEEERDKLAPVTGEIMLDYTTK